MIIRATLVRPVVVQTTPYQWHASSEEKLPLPAVGVGRFHSPSVELLCVVVLSYPIRGLSQQHIAPVQSLHRRSPFTLARIRAGQANLGSVRYSLSIQATTVWPKRTISPCFKYPAHSPWRIPMWRGFACHQWVHQHWLPVNGHLLVHMWVMQSHLILPVEEYDPFHLLKWQLLGGVDWLSRAHCQSICSKWLFRPSAIAILPALLCWTIVWISSVLVSLVVAKVSFYLWSSRALQLFVIV